MATLVRGFHLLFIVQTVFSYVLFTANIDDVKKLAMKFVSESLADKIGGFLAETAMQMMAKSEEMKMDVSEENKEYKPKLSSNEYIEIGRNKNNFATRFKRKRNYRQRENDILNTNTDSVPIQYAYVLNTGKQDQNDARKTDDGVWKRNDIMRGNARRFGDEKNVDGKESNSTINDNIKNENINNNVKAENINNNVKAENINDNVKIENINDNDKTGVVNENIPEDDKSYLSGTSGDLGLGMATAGDGKEVGN